MNKEQRTFKKVIKGRKRHIGKVQLLKDTIRKDKNKRKGITKKRKVLKKK